MKNKKAIIVLTLLIIASLFFIGAEWAGKTAHRLFHSYFADIAIPFGYYLLLVLLEEKYKPFKKWFIKAGAVFTLCALSETLQYFDYYALASVFDPMDYVLYAIGVLLAVFADRILFKRMFDFWD
ncbi:MAG: hypothetical protein HKN53_11345 [Maribacter sp.]|nr:hypothetical protein [Maribacter sp.]